MGGFCNDSPRCPYCFSTARIMLRPRRYATTAAAGIQIGTIDALIARLCIRHGLTLLSTDHDFENIAAHTPLKLLRLPSP